MHDIENVEDRIIIETRYGRVSIPGRDDTISQFLSRCGEWAWDEVGFVASVLPEGARIADVGAYIGTFGLGLSLRKHLGFLCLVEANRTVVPLLETNLRANAKCLYVVVSAMVGGSDLSLRSGRGDPQNLGSISFSFDERAEPIANLPARALTLRQLCIEHGGFDLIKLDVEGMEREILEAASDELRGGETTLWIECNESPKSLALAELVLSWNLETYYFAFPSHNPHNFRGEREPIFPWAYEAGLLVAPKTAPRLGADLEAHKCILRPIKTVAELKDAMWFTPRWLPRDLAHADAAQLAAVAARELLGQSRDEFLSEERTGAILDAAGDSETQAIAGRRDQLAQERQRREAVEAGLAEAQKLAVERLDQLNEERRQREAVEARLAEAQKFAVERLDQLNEERRENEAVEARLAEAKKLAVERLNELSEERTRCRAAEERLASQSSLALSRLADLGAERERAETATREAEGRLDAIDRELRDITAHLATARKKKRSAPSIRINRLVGRGSWLDNMLRRTGRALGLRRKRVSPSGPPREEHEARALAGHFDANYYLITNPDVREAGIDPLAHFMSSGWREGRNPSRDFDVGYYLRVYPDVAAAGVNPLLHYVWAGAAEGRLPRRPLDALRSFAETARHPRDRASEWAAAADHGPPIEPSLLVRSLEDRAGDASAIVLSVSHDDYCSNIGGVQNVIRQERRALEQLGCCAYLHLSPAAPLPLLAEPATPANFRLRVRLGSDHLGVTTVEDLASCLASLGPKGRQHFLVMHHFQGHSPEALEPLVTMADATIAWIHDYFTLCANYNLLRNDVRFCGAPPAMSGACYVCVYGVDRIEHLGRIRRFFHLAQPCVLAPSEAALEVWRKHADDLPAGQARVQPPAHLVLATEPLPARRVAGQIRVAHLGQRILHKGWLVFEALARRFARNPAYAFYQLGAAYGALLPEEIRNVDVQVNQDRPDAMIEAIVEHRIDVVVIWSIWPETFCYTVHEALAGGAFVLTNAAAGHVPRALRELAPDQGCVLENDSELFALFEGGRLSRMVNAAPRRRGVLVPGTGAAPWISRMLSGDVCEAPRRQAALSHDDHVQLTVDV